MNRAALYSRVSTDEQVEKFGLDSQEHECRAHAARKGYEVVAAFRDEGVSGATLDRPALTRLRDAVRDRRVDVVVTHSVDRLSRSLAHQLLLMDEFARAGVTVVFATMNVENSAEGRLLLNVSGVVGEYEREKIRERTARGKRQKARAGHFVVPGQCAYGYRPDAAAPGRLVIDPVEADVVRLIYRLAIDEKKSVRAIATQLRRLGIRPPRGRWTPGQVVRMLRGGYSGLRYFNVKQVQPDGTSRVRPEQEWIAIKVPAIVTPEREEAALAQLALNRAALVGRPPKAHYPLRGLVFCDRCRRRYGGSMRRGGRRRTYMHPVSPAAETCPEAYRSQGADALEAEVRALVTRALSDPATLRAGVERYELSRGVRDVELRSQVAHLKQQIDKVRSDERRLIGLVVSDREQGDIVQELLRELAGRRGALASQLREAEALATQHGAAPGAAQINAVCAKARRGLAKLTDADWEALLREVADEIRIRPDRQIEIHGVLRDVGVTADDAKLSHRP